MTVARLFDAPAEDMERFAVMSKDGRYRYALARGWLDDPQRYVMFVGLNPSTADHHVEDPTLRRCIRFARDWGFDGLWMGNLFALRATDPRELRGATDPVGERTDHWLAHMAKRSEMVVAAWGATPSPVPDRIERVIEMLARDLHCIGGTTFGGHPRHPLYLSASLRPQPWAPTTSNTRRRVGA